MKTYSKLLVGAIIFSIPLVMVFGGLAQMRQNPFPGQPMAQPEQLPDMGETEVFSFSRSEKHEGIFKVSLKEENTSFPVSQSYMAIVVGNPAVSDEIKLKSLRSYPQMMEELYERMMSQMYPLKSTEDSSPFQEVRITTDSGMQVTLKQDDLAEPYVRVRLQGEQMSQEHSINRAFVDQVMKNASVSDEEKARIFDSYPYRLPEKARSSFNSLTREELNEIAEREIAEVRELEFVRFRRIMEDWKQQDDESS